MGQSFGLFEEFLLLFWSSKVSKKCVFAKIGILWTHLSRNLIFLQKSQLSALCHLAAFQHSIYKANASFLMSIFSKGRPWGLNIIMEMELGQLFLTDSRGFTNLYCNWYLSYRFAQCAWVSNCKRSLTLIFDPKYSFTGGPPLTRFSLPRIPLPLFFGLYMRKRGIFALVEDLVSDRISVSVYGIGRKYRYRYRSRKYRYWYRY